METLLKDIRYGVRMLLKSPSFSIVATIALGLGIGANTAIFTVVNSVLLRPLPFPNSERLMTLWETDSRRTISQGSASYPNFADWREQSQSFEKMAVFHYADYTLTGKSDAVRVQGAVVSAELFSLLGVGPVVGRAFLLEEDAPGENHRVAIVSYGLFEKRFNANRNLIGQPIVIDGENYLLVGVMPRDFEFPIQNEPAELWTTVAREAEGETPPTQQRGAHYLRVIGRLKPNVTRVQAQSELNAIAARLEQQYPEKNLHRGINVVPALDALVGDIRPALLVMLGAVGLVLLIACANVANLLLARAMGRHREMAIRAALGASRWRVIRQLLTESILLSLTGGALGLLLAIWWSDLLVALNQKEIPRALHVGLDLRVLGFTLGVSILTGLIFGVMPAFSSTKLSLGESLKDGRGAGEGAKRNKLRGTLVVSELAIAVVLLVGAGLLIQSLWRLSHVHPGFDSRNVTTFTLGLPEVKYSTEKQDQLFRDLAVRIQSLPGVQSASTVAPLPLSGDNYSLSFETEGRPVPKGEEPSADFATIGLNYFRTLGIPLLKGRDFNEQDQHKSQQVIIVNQSFARNFFPNQEVLGQHIKPGISSFEGEKASMREIVGVVGDVKHRSLSREARPAFYVPQSQVPFDYMTIAVKTDGDVAGITNAAQNEVRQLDPQLPVFNIQTMDQYVAASMATPRFNTTLLGIFAAVALVLTIVGLYGVTSYAVVQRTNEIGIRMALGAQAADVLRLIIGQGIKLVVIGVALGLGGAYALTRLISSLLFGVGTKDTLTFVVVAAVLALIALVACYVPARRATKVDPLVALRYE
jgi:putative ABC transport system permease protein